jgi:ABC-type arginine transport system permease subunit
MNNIFNFESLWGHTILLFFMNKITITTTTNDIKNELIRKLIQFSIFWCKCFNINLKFSLYLLKTFYVKFDKYK